MMNELVLPRQAMLERLMNPLARFDLGDVDLENACQQYESAGYEVSTWLRRFILQYSEITIFWSTQPDGLENKITTAVEVALEAPTRNVRIYSKRLGHPVLPVGMIFDTEERVLLAENGDITIGGDAGLQKVANGFERSIQALLSDDWDKTFFW
jgi:SUKH-3 immunity protein